METIKTKTGVISFKEGTLRKSLKMKKDEKFKKAELRRLKKVKVGSSFKFHKRNFKMTKLMKQRVSLGLTLMGFK
jgi:hypothetical protein|tara:strand:+ start:8143 stop:8367 length:225 start_codon:yes stop_codon:yes gene_type:complete